MYMYKIKPQRKQVVKTFTSWGNHIYYVISQTAAQT